MELEDIAPEKYTESSVMKNKTSTKTATDMKLTMESSDESVTSKAPQPITRSGRDVKEQSDSRIMGSDKFSLTFECLLFMFGESCKGHNNPWLANFEQELNVSFVCLYGQAHSLSFSLLCNIPFKAALSYLKIIRSIQRLKETKKRKDVT